MMTKLQGIVNKAFTSYDNGSLRDGEAPAEPMRALARRPPEAWDGGFDASGGRRPDGRLRLGGSLALPVLGST
jgi:hypothetical protein